MNRYLKRVSLSATIFLGVLTSSGAAIADDVIESAHVCSGTMESFRIWVGNDCSYTVVGRTIVTANGDRRIKRFVVAAGGGEWRTYVGPGDLTSVTFVTRYAEDQECLVFDPGLNSCG
jgi:hypothetical protein